MRLPWQDAAGAFRRIRRLSRDAPPIILFIAGAILSTTIQLIAEGSLGRMYFLVAVFLVLLVFLHLRVSDIDADLNSLSSKVGLKVTYWDRGAFERGSFGGNKRWRAKIYTRLQEFVASAEREVLVLAFPEPIPSDPKEWNETNEDWKARATYLQALMTRVRDKEIRYRRIVQVAPGQSINGAYWTPDVEHYADMSKAHDEGAHHIVLRKSALNIPTAFVLIDDTNLVVQLTSIQPSSQQAGIHGLFFIEDPTKTVTKHFRSLFERIDSGRGTEWVPREELESLSEPSTMLRASHEQTG